MENFTEKIENFDVKTEHFIREGENPRKCLKNFSKKFGILLQIRNFWENRKFCWES